MTLSHAERETYSKPISFRGILGVLYPGFCPPSLEGETWEVVKFLTGHHELPTDLFDTNAGEHYLMAVCRRALQAQFPDEFDELRPPTRVQSREVSEAWIALQFLLYETDYLVHPALLEGVVYEMYNPNVGSQQYPRYELDGLAHYMTGLRKREATLVVCTNRSRGGADGTLIWSLADFLGDGEYTYDDVSDPTAPSLMPIRRFRISGSQFQRS